jgi:hypothetical protein
VFLKSRYMEIGLNAAASFGTVSAPPTGFKSKQGVTHASPDTGIGFTAGECLRGDSDESSLAGSVGGFADLPATLYCHGPTAVGGNNDCSNLNLKLVP